MFGHGSEDHTVLVNAEVGLYQERHGAIIQPRQVMQWLDEAEAGCELLVTPPPRTFVVEEIAKEWG